MHLAILIPIACSRALGMQTHQIPDWQITSSSQWDANHAAVQGRLFFQAAGNKQGAWSARKNDINQWLQINLGCNGNTVTRVATQGRNAYNQWVTKYALQYSGDGLHFHFYKEKGQLKNKVNLDLYFIRVVDSLYGLRSLYDFKGVILGGCFLV